MNVKQEFITPNKYTRPQIKLQQVKAIAIHYAGDPGASAQNIRDYFAGTCIRAKRYASCHYAVGLAGEIIQLIPEDEWSYCTNQANGYTISIETCHPDSSGKFNVASEQALIDLAALLCKKYGLNPADGGLLRHYDVTGKACPKYYVDHPAAWEAFKKAVSNCMAGALFALPSYGTTVSASAVNPDSCDTVGTLTMCTGMEYQFKSGSAITCANSSFAQIAHTVGADGYHYTKFRAQALTAGVGFYVNGKRACIGVVKRPTCDTAALTKKVGEIYQFKSDFPLVCGNGAIWQQQGTPIHEGGWYYTKFKATAKGTAGFYCGLTRVCVGTII